MDISRRDFLRQLMGRTTLRQLGSVATGPLGALAQAAASSPPRCLTAEEAGLELGRRHREGSKKPHSEGV